MKRQQPTTPKAYNLLLVGKRRVGRATGGDQDLRLLSVDEVSLLISSFETLTDTHFVQ
jgi:hypothetical protein